MVPSRRRHQSPAHKLPQVAHGVPGNLPYIGGRRGQSWWPGASLKTKHPNPAQDIPPTRSTRRQCQTRGDTPCAARPSNPSRWRKQLSHPPPLNIGLDSMGARSNHNQALNPIGILRQHAQLIQQLMPVFYRMQFLFSFAPDRSLGVSAEWMDSTASSLTLQPRRSR